MGRQAADRRAVEQRGVRNGDHQRSASAGCIEWCCRRHIDAVKVYGNGSTEVRALDGVTVAFREPGGSRPSWARRGRASRRCCTASPVSTRSRGGGVHRRRRPEHARRQPAHPAAPRPRRLRVPGVQPRADADGAGEHHAAADACRARRPTASGSTRSSTPSGSAIGCDHRPSELSGGQQQRVAVARALGEPAARSSSPTSRPATSTRKPAPRCSAFMRRAVRRHGPDDRDGDPRPGRRQLRRPHRVPGRRPGRRRDARRRPPSGCSTA